MSKRDRLRMTVEKSNQDSSGSALQQRSFFNRPSWSRPQALSNDTDLFHRSSQTYVDLAAQAERTRKREIARRERERVRQDSRREPDRKRRRTSDDEDDDDDYTISNQSSSQSSYKDVRVSPSQTKTDHTTPFENPRKPLHSPISLLRHYEAEVAASKTDEERRERPEAPNIIDLDLEEEFSALSGQEPTSKSAVVKPDTLANEDSQLVSDEEFPELARQARERVRRKRLHNNVISDTASSQDGQLSLHQPKPPISQYDPVLQILVTSNIDNTVPLIVSRRLSQRLKDVRLAWAKRQNFTIDFTTRVFLTWRGNRVFDVTTCKSLGITVDAIGRISTKGGLWEEEEGQIHMQAMTPEMLEAYKESKRNEGSCQEGKTAPKEALLVQDDEAQVRIILKAKGLDDFKLQVRPSTLVAKITSAFRTRYQIDGEKDVFLSFDGERLSPDRRIDETELSDMDTIEAYCK